MKHLSADVVDRVALAVDDAVGLVRIGAVRAVEVFNASLDSRCRV
jgi:hypothetical protein